MLVESGQRQPVSEASGPSLETPQDDAHILDIVRSAPALLYSYKMNHVTGVSSFPYCSDFCSSLLGVPAQAVMKDPAAMVNLVHPDDIPVFTNAVVKSMSDLSLFDETLRMKHATKGHYMNLLDRSHPFREQELNPVTGDYETVTIWKGFIMEKPLDSCADKFKTSPTTSETQDDLHVSVLMESPLIPFFALHAASGTVHKWNQVMAEATGFKAEEVMGKEAASLFGWKNTTASGSFLDTLLETPKYACQITSKSGNEVHLVLSASKPTHHHHHQHYHASNTTVHVLCQDVTQLHQVTAQRNLATKMAESERSLTEWLSHEIRNPLSVVMEAAQTLEDHPHDAKDTSMNDLQHSVFGGSYLQLIRHSITYVVDILSNMLDLNKLAEGKIVLRPETCRIQHDILLPTLQMMGLCGKIPIRIDDDSPEVELHVDKLRLKQVFANLVSNSLKYTSRGTIRIKVHPCTDSFLTVTISDTGIGIQPSQYEHLFSRYEQLGSSVNGAGIGLCLCKSLLTAMGGDIFLNKDYNSGLPGFPGSQFVVRLPYTKKPATPAFDALSAALMSTATTVSKVTTTTPIPTIQASTKAQLKGAFRILVVDDELIGQKLLIRRFQRIFPSANIDSSPSGEQAVEMAQRLTNKYDLITMDHYMKVGEMTGAETIQELRRVQVDALIVGISGNAMRDKHLQAGADWFFQKPMPATNVVVQDLYGKLPPPAEWRVLLVDDAEVNLQLMERKLQQVAVPHATNSSSGGETTRWEIIKCTLVDRAKALLEEQSFDLVVLDQTMQGETITGIELGQFGRQTAKNNDAIFILNSGSSVDSLPTWFDLSWSKPLPSVSEMRQDLFQKLLSSPESTNPASA